ncbi:hypothetical protein FB451DRAFT_1391543 [Mycena latifolia]|nr:hypothetical protein FB451DRAFT_1391543 [Mycena latifolia]
MPTSMGARYGCASAICIRSCYARKRYSRIERAHALPAALAELVAPLAWDAEIQRPCVPQSCLLLSPLPSYSTRTDAFPAAYNYTSATTPGAHGYSDAPGQQSYSDAPRTGTSPTTASYTHPTTGTSDYFVSSSEGGSSTGFAALGMAGAAGAAAGSDAQSTRTRQTGYDAQSTRGHTAGQPSTGSSASLPNAYGGVAPSVSGSGSGSGSRNGGGSGRREVGPLPQKRRPPPPAPAPPPPGAGAGSGRSGSEEPFLAVEEAEADEHPSWLEPEPAFERHRDAGPVSDVSLGRSPSGRLPPAYGEQM